MSSNDVAEPTRWQFRRPSGGLFVLTAPVIATIDRYRQRRHSMPEAGGILLGRIIVHAPRAVVDEVTEPSQWDRWTRFSFFRAKEPAQRAINRAWSKSDQTRIYLGDWHTHPEDDPTPSALDRREWINLSRTATYEQDVLFFVIAGRREIRAWEVMRGDDEVRTLIASAPLSDGGPPPGIA